MIMPPSTGLKIPITCHWTSLMVGSISNQSLAQERIHVGQGYVPPPRASWWSKGTFGARKRRATRASRDGAFTRIVRIILPIFQKSIQEIIHLILNLQLHSLPDLVRYPTAALSKMHSVSCKGPQLVNKKLKWT